MKNHLITNLELPSNKRDAACVEFVNYRINVEVQNYVKVDGSNGMTDDLDMNDNKIITLNTDDKAVKSATNVGYFKNTLLKVMNKSQKKNTKTILCQHRPPKRHLQILDGSYR